MFREEGVLAALADACVEDFGEDFIFSGKLDGVVVDELDGTAERADESYSLVGWDLD